MDGAQAPSAVFEIAVPGGALQVDVAGAGTPVVLLHGWALDRRVWQNQIEVLSRRFRVIAIDRRGFGQSTAPPDLAAEVDDLMVVRSTLGLGRIVLVGMSQGGRIALHFALARPELIRGLVLQGAPLDGFQPDPHGEDAIPLTSYRALARLGHLDKMKELWRGHPLMRTAPAARGTLDEMLRAYEGRDLVSPSADELSPIAGDLEDIYAPSLVVTGENDTPWRQLVGDALAYGLPNSRRVRIAGADHLCNVTHPEVFNELVASFVKQVEALAPRQSWP